MKNVVYFGKCYDGPLEPPEGVKVWVGAKGGKSTLSLETVCRFPSNLVRLIPRGFEPEVHMGHVTVTWNCPLAVFSLRF